MTCNHLEKIIRPVIKAPASAVLRDSHLIEIRRASCSRDSMSVLLAKVPYKGSKKTDTSMLLLLCYWIKLNKKPTKFYLGEKEIL